ncbi:MAG TPA: alpha-glucosidase/alpha-galactosidase, partial [Rhodobacteraceae bacterium]|nr:alpha-glucosidase/alpha-galactosidase [Paracoccaceae bacterium]
GDVLHYPALKNAHIALMDIDETRLLESQLVAQKLILSLKADSKITTHLSQREALDGADFVVVCFQIGGFEPCT